MITKKKIRKVFPPLTITVSTETSGSASQVYESMTGVWTPNRSEQAFVITPHVMVTTESKDTTWMNGDYVSKLTGVQWYANGVAIEQSGLAGKFTVETGATNRGRITISKNLSPSETYDLVMKGTFNDSRNNQNITIQTDPIHMAVSERTANEWDLSVVHDTDIRYYPLLDRLKEYDWKVRNDKIAASDAEKAKCYDGNQYDIKLPIIISRGSGVISSSDRDWSKCEIKTYVIKDGVAYEFGVGSSSQLSFITSKTKEQIGIDLRLVPGGTVMEIALFVSGIKMASEFLTFSVIINDYTCEPTNEGDLDPNAKYRYDRALCSCNGKVMEYPEAYLNMRWFTNSSNKSAVEHGTGETINIDIARASIGTANNCWLEVYIESLVKALVSVISVSDGNAVLVNGDGDFITSDMLVN